MNKKTTGLLSTAVSVALLMPSIAHATLGMDLIGFGAKSRGMGGIGIAYAQDSLSISNNPANAAKVGNRLDIGMEIFNVKMSVAHDSALLPIEDPSNPDSLGIGNSKYENFPLPFIGYADNINEDLSWGIAVIGAGLLTRYDQPENTFFNFNGLGGEKVGVFLIRMMFLPSIAYEVNDDVTVGATLVLAAQGFKAQGLGAFGALGFSNQPNELLTSNQWDMGYGLGFRLGALWDATDELTVGVNYSPRVNMSEFDRYKGLFAEQGDFDIAEEYSIGINYKFTPAVNVSFEIQQVNYSDVASLGNAGPLANNPNEFYPLCPGVDKEACKLGGDSGMGFGWKDQTRFRLGGDYQYTDKVTLRAGWAYAESPIPEDQVLFNILAPATIENNLTLGASYQYSESMEMSMNYLHAFQNTIKGKTAFTPDGLAPVQNPNAALAMTQNGIGFSLGIKF